MRYRVNHQVTNNLIYRTRMGFQFDAVIAIIDDLYTKE